MKLIAKRDLKEHLEDLDRYSLNEIELVLAFQNEQITTYLSCPMNTSVEAFFLLLKAEHPELYLKLQSLLNLNGSCIGVYSQVVSLTYILKHQDRVEVYRELTVDPKLARLRRALVKDTRRAK